MQEICFTNQRLLGILDNIHSNASGDIYYPEYMPASAKASFTLKIIFSLIICGPLLYLREI